MPTQETTFSDLTFIERQSRLARWFARPLKRFMAVESAGGVVLLVATAAALIWVNSPWGHTYDDFWNTTVNIFVGDIEIFAGHPLSGFVNDALMALFFFVVGLEIKRELVDGQLKRPRDAALPAFGALGGMVVPALLFLAFNAGHPGQDGWGIPMATDIAFAVGIVSLLGDRISRKLRVFILSLAIVDDIGAIMVIALFYTSGIGLGWLAATGGLIVLIIVLKWLRVWYIPLYVLIGAIMWWTTYRSGVHSTIAGVILGLLTPAHALQNADDTRTVARWLRDKPDVFPVDVHYASFRIRESVSVVERLETALHPISSYAIIPIFALANAGVRLNGSIISAAMESRVTWGIIVGLVLGKTIGVSAFSLIATRLKIAKMPPSMTIRHLVGLAMIAGIGFTVSLFVNDLAFGDDGHAGDSEHALFIDEVDEGGPEPSAFVSSDTAQNREDNAKIGILFASVIASIGGLLLLSGARQVADPDDDKPPKLSTSH